MQQEATNAAVDGQKEIEKRLIELEARLVEQDHRFVPVVMTYLASRREFAAGDRRRDAALRALLWSLFYSPATVAITGTAVAVVTLAVLVWQNLLVKEQNDYLRRQIDQQQLQIDTQQRIDNQTVRNTAIEQIFGPEFVNNPRVKAEAVRSLVTVERARIANGNNTLPTDWINLHEADLTAAWLETADLKKTSFRKSILERANFNKASLEQASIRHSRAIDTDFIGSDMREMNIAFTDFSGAQFISANLQRAAFFTCDLTGADLSGTDVMGASFYRTQLMNTDLHGVKNWQQIASMEETNIYGVKNAPPGFAEWALAHGAISSPHALANIRALAEEALRLEETTGSSQ